MITNPPRRTPKHQQPRHPIPHRIHAQLVRSDGDEPYGGGVEAGEEVEDGGGEGGGEVGDGCC